MEKPVLYFDDISIGQEFSPLSYTLTEEKVKQYIEAVKDFNLIYYEKVKLSNGDYAYRVPPAIVSIFILKSYNEYFQSPPGNIHAKQYFKFFKPLYSGEELNMQAKVVDKYLKKERKFVVIETKVTDIDGEEKVRSLKTFIWAK